MKSIITKTKTVELICSINNMFLICTNYVFNIVDVDVFLNYKY